MRVLLVSLLILAPSVSFAKPEKIDWKPCKKEIEEYCTAYLTDLEKHECLEELSKGKVSKACMDHNKKVEAKLGHKHDEKHAH